MLFLLLFMRLLWAAPGPLSVSPGSPALVFELPAVNVPAALRAVNKSRISLTDLTGVLPSHPKRAVVIHFFAINGSRAALKALDKLQHRYKGKDVQVLGICGGGENLSSLSAAVQEQGVRFPVLHDVHQVVSARYGITEFPITILVDSDGHVFAIGQPTGEAFEREISAELDGLLAG